MARFNCLAFEVFMKNKLFTIICSAILFLSSFYMLSQHILAAFEYKAYNGYLDYQNCYTIWRQNVPLAFNSVEDIIKTAEQMSDSYIIIAKKSNKSFAVYAKNYNYQIPLQSGRMFSENDYNSNQLVTMDNNDLSSIATLFNDFTFTNLLAEDLSFSIENPSFELLSNLKLSNEYSQAIDNEWIEPYYFEKIILFLLIFAILFFIVTILYSRNSIREIIVRKFLGNNYLDITIDFIIRFTLLMLTSFAIAFISFYMLDMQLFKLEIIRNEILINLFMQLILVELVVIVEAIMIYLVIRFVPIKKIGWGETYD